VFLTLSSPSWSTRTARPATPVICRNWKGKRICLPKSVHNLNYSTRDARAETSYDHGDAHSYIFSFYPFANAGSGDSCDVSIIRKCIRSIRLLNL
jgi:hypothetical protein